MPEESQNCPLLFECKNKIGRRQLGGHCLGGFDRCHVYLRRKGELKTPFEWLTLMLSEKGKDKDFREWLDGEIELAKELKAKGLMQ